MQDILQGLLLDDKQTKHRQIISSMLLKSKLHTKQCGSIHHLNEVLQSGSDIVGVTAIVERIRDELKTIDGDAS